MRTLLGDARLPNADQIRTLGIFEWARLLLVRLYEMFRRIDILLSRRPNDYGEMYSENAAFAIVIAAGNTWTTVGGGFSAGTTNAFTFQNASELKCNVAGKYEASWSLSLETTGANDDIEGGVAVGGTIQTNTISHAKVATPNEEFHLSSHGIISLALEDVVTIQVNNNTDGDDLVLEHANLLLVKLDD